MALSILQQNYRSSQQLHFLLLQHRAPTCTEPGARGSVAAAVSPLTPTAPRCSLPRAPPVCLSILQSPSQVRLLFAPPGLAGLEEDCSLSAVRLLFLFSASFPAPPAAAPPAVPPSLPPPFSLSLSLSLSRVLLERSDIFTDELLPVTERWRCGYYNHPDRFDHRRADRTFFVCCWRVSLQFELLFGLLLWDKLPCTEIMVTIMYLPDVGAPWKKKEKRKNSSAKSERDLGVLTV